MSGDGHIEWESESGLLSYWCAEQPGARRWRWNWCVCVNDASIDSGKSESRASAEESCMISLENAVKQMAADIFGEGSL